MAGSQKTRMAGDKLSQAERHERARRRIGNDPERLKERISIVDRDKYDVSGYTDKEINMALQGAIFNEQDYSRLTGKKPGGGNETDKPEKPPTNAGGGNNGGINIDTGGDQSITKPAPQPPAERPPTPLYGGVTQEINQDNDIVNTITGNNNTVTNSQDNSINQKVYGGSNRYFNYSSSPKMPVEPNPGTDPTMPTMNAKDFLKDFMKDFYSDTIVI